MGHGAVADEIKGRQAHGERTGSILEIAEAGVRFRSYLDGSEQFMAPETSMEIQAALHSDIALVFDECTPFNVTREYTARSTERTHRWLDRCLAWHAEHGPDDQMVYGIVQGGVEEDLRRASAQEVAARGPGGIAIGGTLGRGQAADVRGRRVGGLRAAGLPAPPSAGDRRDRRPAARRRARDRHVRLRDADPHRPPRDGGRAGPGRALAGRPRQGPLPRRPTSRSSRAARARPARAATPAPTSTTC